MEKDTVVLDVKKYNELRDFKTKIEEGKKLSITLIFDGYTYGRTALLYTDDEIVVSLSKTNEELAKCIKKLNIEIADLETERTNGGKTKNVTIDDIKNMGLWEFRKWKNKD